MHAHIDIYLSKHVILNKNTTHANWKFFLIFKKINIGTQKSSIHSIFPAGSTSLHACLYRHFSLKTACYLNKNTTHANWKFFLVFKKINIGTQKSSIHSIFLAGSTSLHACLYRHFSLKTACYLNKNTTHANWKFFLVFKKINIGTQKSSIHSIFPAGSTSLHACLYRHFSLKTACYLNKNTTHANWTKCHFHGPKQGNNQRGKIPYLLKCVGSVLVPPKSETMEEEASSSLSPFFLSSCFLSFLSFFSFFLSLFSFFSSCLRNVCHLSSKYQVGLT